MNHVAARISNQARFSLMHANLTELFIIQSMTYSPIPQDYGLWIMDYRIMQVTNVFHKSTSVLFGSITFNQKPEIKTKSLILFLPI